MLLEIVFYVARHPKKKKKYELEFVHEVNQEQERNAKTIRVTYK